MDFSELGFKCGIEVHQRLSTERKLFCSCRPRPSLEGPSAKVKRKLRAVVGELGVVDRAAAFEAEQGKEFLYELFDDEKTTCLIEVDEEPPHPLNGEALETALVVARMLDARVLEEVHVMRKQVIDGSSPSGFQRTALVAVDGMLDTSKGAVRVPTICLEEESAGIVERKEGFVAYRLDRLGIPLLELATDASIRDGEHAREVAEAIGLLLRSTGAVQRGIGTIRQDVNISIAGGARVELKGAQELGDIPKLVASEVGRQNELVAIRRALEERGAANKSKPVFKSVSPALRNARGFISQALAAGKSAMAVKLEKFAGLLGREIMPAHRFGTELSDYAKTRGVKGVIHSDEDPRKYGLLEYDFGKVGEVLGCGTQDAWVVCIEDELKAVEALEAVHGRAYAGVPEETRRVEGVISRFMRPMPGSARMYPETDVMPVRVSKEMLSSLALPKSFDERRREYWRMGLNEELAEKLLRSTEFDLFERLNAETGADPTLIAATLLETMKALRREGVEVDSLAQERLAELFSLYSRGRIVKAAVPELLKLMVRENVGVEKLVEAGRLSRISGKELQELVEGERPLVKNAKMLFGEVMRKNRLRVDASELESLLKG